MVVDSKSIYMLISKDGPSPEQEYELTEGEIIIGRDPGADIIMSTPIQPENLDDTQAMEKYHQEEEYDEVVNQIETNYHARVEALKNAEKVYERVCFPLSPYLHQVEPLATLTTPGCG